MLDKTQMQKKLSKTSIDLDSKIIDFLRLLEEYRRKCLREGNLEEA